MIRLGIDGRELIPGVRTGIGRYVREVLRAVCAREWDCIVYSNGPVCRGDIPSRIMIKTLPQRWTAWWDQVTLPRQLKKDGISAWLSPYYKAPLMTPCPTIITIHDLFFIGYPGQARPVYDTLMTRLGRLYAGCADAVIADSDYSKRSIIDRLRLHPGKITIIPVALGNEFRREPLSARIQRTYGLSVPYVLYVGNFKPHKNIPR
ncbi:MAG: glycosyltransferase, partial [Nitrospiraceae bacterium]